MIADGFSVVLIVREIERCFNGEQPSGEVIDSGTIAQEEEAKRADEAKMAEAREWFGKTFCDAVETDSLPIPQTTLGNGPAEMCLKHYPLSVSKEEVQAVKNRFNVKEGTLLQAAWALLLAAYSAEDKASYSTLYFGHGDRRTHATVAMMVRTMPVFLQSRGEEPLEELFATLTEQMETVKQQPYYTYQDVVKDYGLNNQVMFVYRRSWSASSNMWPNVRMTSSAWPATNGSPSLKWTNSPTASTLHIPFAAAIASWDSPYPATRRWCWHP